MLLSLLKKKIPKKKFKIKWPNDIYLGEKKLAGILIETNIVKNNIVSLVIGVGINFISSPTNLEYKTISIGSLSDKLNPLIFFFQLTEEINKSLKNLKINIYKQDINILKNFKDFGRIINIKRNGNIVNGIFFGIGNNGEIILKKNDKLNLINYGDII